MAAIGPSQPTPQDSTSIHQSPGTTNAQQTIGKEVQEGRMLSVKERAKAIEQAVNQGPIGHIQKSGGNQQVTVLTPVVTSSAWKKGEVPAQAERPAPRPQIGGQRFNEKVTIEDLTGHGLDSTEVEDTTDIESTDEDPGISASNINNNSAIDVADVSDKVKDQLKTAEKVAKVVGACLLVAGGLAIFTVSLLAGFTLGPVALIGTIAGGALFSLGIGLAMHAAIGDKDEKDKADADALTGDAPPGPTTPSFGPAAGSPRIDRRDDDAVRREDD